MHHAHPSRILNDLFGRRSYQGVPQENARFLFVGLDANYAADIERSPVFPEVLAYHEDGPAFWRAYGAHHPPCFPATRETVVAITARS